MPVSISFIPRKDEATRTSSGKNFLFIVGDKFRDFCRKSQIIQYAAAIELINSGSINAQILIMGQGIGAAQLESLKKALSERGLLESVLISEKISQKIEPHLVHKRRSENVLISKPVVKGESRFAAFMVIDENCDEMGDHLTGSHIPGILLVEAARQMFMACSELSQRREGFTRRFEYMLQKIEIEFTNFLFPLDVDIHLEFLGVKWDPKKTRGSARILFNQFGREVCEALCTGAGFPDPTVSVLENRQCAKAYRYLDCQQPVWKMNPQNTHNNVSIIK